MTNFLKPVLTLTLACFLFIPTLSTHAASNQCYSWRIINGKRQYTYFPCKNKKVVASKPKQSKIVLVKFNYSGNKEGWMKAAGIEESDFSAVDFLVTRESSWNPNAINKSSGACGLMQFLPCSTTKAGADWNNPVTALKKGNDYVNARYGSWNNAVAFWQKNHWY